MTAQEFGAPELNRMPLLFVISSAPNVISSAPNVISSAPLSCHSERSPFLSFRALPFLVIPSAPLSCHSERSPFLSSRTLPFLVISSVVERSKKGIPSDASLYIPMHEGAPSAVSTAVITDAMICSVHFNVSFFVILYPPFCSIGSTSLSSRVPPFCHLDQA